jgi:transcription elongation factor Elf1
MVDDHLSVTFECKECGGTILTVPDDATDDSPVSCKSCGFVFGSFGDVKAKAREAALEHVQDTIKGAFKGLKGWTLK